MNKLQTYTALKILALGASLFLLSACGFSVYNKSDIPLQLATIHLQTNNPYDSFSLALKHDLPNFGFKFSDHQKEKIVTLNIINTSFTNYNPIAISSTQTSTYYFTYTVTFNLQTRDGKNLTDPQTINVYRNLILNPNEVLEASSEVDTLRAEMEKDLVFQLVSMLNSAKTKQHLLQTTLLQ